MERSLRIRATVVLLGLLTLSAAVMASLNFTREGSFPEPTDQVWWVEAAGGLRADQVIANGPGARAGIKQGDLLTDAGGTPIHRMAGLVRQWFKTGIYQKLDYDLIRAGVPIEASVILEPANRNIHEGLRLIGLIYLAIGLYVLFRRWTAWRATHFYVFCLTSFVLYSFNYTGQLDTFDWAIYWGKIAAEALQPALFLHFALAFAEDHPGRSRKKIYPLIYLPGAAILALQVIALTLWSATELLATRLDHLAMGYLGIYYLAAALVFLVEYRHQTNPLRRQQLKWLTRGTLLTVVPLTVLYIIPYLAGIPVSNLLTDITGVSLLFLPLMFSWAIVRYRLMDVDLIFKRGVTYTLATAALVGVYFAAIALAAELVHKRLPSAGVWVLIAVIIVTAQLFEPLKRLIQNRVDRIFDRRRYDYRQALIEFGRGLSSETDLETLLHRIVDHLPKTLLVERVGIFLPGPTTDRRRGYLLKAAHGLPEPLANRRPEDGKTNLATGSLDLRFLDFDQPGAGSHIFLENPEQALHLTESERRAASELDLNYYLPCRLQNRTIAVIGLGRTADGDFLSSEDVELLESLASYIGIAIQNAQLYATLEQKAAEYERLKEFNENIVESINVGIFAVNLEERIDSWNAQMEVMYATARREAIGQKLSQVMPADFVSEFSRFQHEPGVHNLYKFRIHTPAGETRIANIAVAPLVSRSFDVVGRIVIVDDITERLELEAQLAQADKLSSIGLLAAGVAHEVNTPLAVISSYTQMLSKKVNADDAMAPLLDRITQQTFRASDIVNSLLNFSRTSGTEFTEVDLNHVIQDALKLLEHQFHTSQIRLETALDPELPPVWGNQGKLQQVFLNLFLNARDAMPEGGALRVRTMVNGEVAVEVCDTGTGISSEDMQRIYDPFFTTKSAPSPGRRRGTGLGLAVTYGIIQEHSGKIQVESELGKGATFRLEFPRARNAAHA